MYQVQARVIYPKKDDGWSAPTREMPTFYMDCALSWEAAAKAVEMFDPFAKDDSGITVNMTVMRMVSWYGQDMRAEFERVKPLAEEAPPIEYYQQKDGRMAQLESAAGFTGKAETR